jgi:hypothetical protein
MSVFLMCFSLWLFFWVAVRFEEPWRCEHCDKREFHTHE